MNVFLGPTGQIVRGGGDFVCNLSFLCSIEASVSIILLIARENTQAHFSYHLMCKAHKKKFMTLLLY